MIKWLRIKFILINMAIVIIMLSIIFGTVFTLTQQNLEQESIRMMQSIAQNPMQLGRPDEIDPALRLPYFTLEIDGNGSFRSMGGGFFDLSDDAFLKELANQVLADGGETGVLEAYRLRYCRVNMPFTQFIIFADMSSEYSTMENLIFSCALIGLGSLLVFLIISIALSHWAIRPVEQAWAQQKQFVADASHELKTPLTVILTNAELLQDQNDPTFSENILKMAGKMKGLVENLLELAKVDGGIPNEVFSDTDLSTLINDTALPFEPLYFEKGLKLETMIQPDIRMTGSPTHLSQLAGILLDNAMKYAYPKGIVLLRLVRTGKKSCLLSVANPGEAMTEAECSDIFKRFYRRDTVRSINGSYGLGLPIAQGIVERHKGKIWAESQNGINTFHVQLPIK